MNQKGLAVIPIVIGVLVVISIGVLMFMGPKPGESISLKDRYQGIPESNSILSIYKNIPPS